MKATCWPLVMVMLLSSPSAMAQHRARTDSVDVTIRLNRAFAGASPVDSVLVIFDRYDLAGAGVVKKVFYPTNNQFIISRVPAGKYYIGILCLGPYQQFFSETTFVNKRRSNNLVFNLKRCQQYIPGIYVPTETIDMSRLAVTRPDSFK
jgi:hypothetical protein